jgi:hypothetical protein
MRVTKPESIEDLQGNPLVDLLNAKPGGVFFKKAGPIGFNQELQNEVREDILPLIAPKKALESQEVKARLEKLLDKINAMDLKPVWTVERFKKGAAVPLWGRLARIQGYRWTIQRTLETKGRDLPRKMVYLIIAAALETGKIGELQKCGGCGRIFAPDDSRRRFCSDHCRIVFNNNSRLKSGYFFEQRKEKRKRGLAKAKRLLEEGKSPEQVISLVNETRLSIGILRRAGLLNGQYSEL